MARQYNKLHQNLHTRSEKQTLLWTPHFKLAVATEAQERGISINQFVIDVLSEELHKMEKM